MRITKLKSAVRCISVFVTFLVATGTLYAYDSIVTGNDNPELDVKAVQEAVDKGGSVLLKGTFNFVLLPVKAGPTFRRKTDPP